MSRSSIRFALAAAAALATCPAGFAAAQSSILATVPDPAQPSELRSRPAETLAAAAANPEWSPPRTSWGDPSLAGVWTSDDMRSVPMNRPEQFGTRQSLTDEEFVARASQDQGARDDAVNVGSFLQHEYGVRTFGYTSMIIDPPDGRMPPLTPEGEAINASRTRGTYGPGPFDAFTDFSLYDRCITRGPLGSILPAIYGNGVRIVQSPGYVSITSEMIHETRIIHLGDTEPLDQSLRQFSGSARGHWEGDTLVVESGNYTDRASVSRVPTSSQFRLTERFTRVDPEMVEYVATVEDPVTLTEPFTFRLMLSTQPGFTLYEYSCHEGNQAVRNSLSGERVYEQQVAEAIANGEPIPERATEHTQIRNGDPEFRFDINAGE
ncbi:MAG TPA: hypothetical protein VKQ06_08315 [Gammaproteobacteria bacterium]|nr:hypothetical protein [Gammaproteobacteria bacterium]